MNPIESSPSDFSRSRAPKQLTKHNRTVSFFASVKVYKVPSAKSLGRRETRAVWYSEFDYCLIQAELQHDLWLLSEGMFRDSNDGSCIRGLDCKTPEKVRQRTYNRKVAQNAVQWEQNEQKKLRGKYPERIAQAYVSASRHCQVEAYIRAIKDRDDAR